MLDKNYAKAPNPLSDLKIFGFLYLTEKPDRKSINIMNMVKLLCGITSVLVNIFDEVFFYFLSLTETFPETNP